MSFANRRFLLNRRRLIKPRRRLRVVAREGPTLTYKCLTCGHTKKRTSPSEFEAKLLERWHGTDGSDCSGDCKVCTKAARDKLYPLPKGVK